MPVAEKIVKFVDEFTFILVDKKVYDLYPEIKSALDTKTYLSLEEPESYKNIKGFEQVSNFFLNNNISRDDELLVIGGGALSDLGGYVASSLLRGISWSVIPTTLLSMIDASIGGKVGINTPAGKNLLGAFHEPKSIMIDNTFLKTLDACEIQSGRGELLKYLFLDKDILNEFSLSGPGQKTLEMCADYKKRIVQEDFKESGKRKLLNLGHTLGHIIEVNENLPHGIAVAYGLELILKLYSPNLLECFNELTKKLELELPKKSFEGQFIYEALSKDKKSKKDGSIDLIIPRSVGDVVIETVLIEELVKKINDLC